MSLKIWLIAVLFLAAYVAPSLQEEQEEVEEGHENAELSDLEDPSPGRYYGCTNYCKYYWCRKYLNRKKCYYGYKHWCCRCRWCSHRMIAGDEVEMKSDENHVEDAPKEVEESDENAELSDLEDPSPRKYYGDEVEMKSDEEQVEDSEDPGSLKKCRYYIRCSYPFGRKYCRKIYVVRCSYRFGRKYCRKIYVVRCSNPFGRKYCRKIYVCVGCNKNGTCYKWCAKYRKQCKRGSKRGCCRCRWCSIDKGDEVEMKSDENQVEDAPKEVKESDENAELSGCASYGYCYHWCTKNWKLCKRGSKHGCCRCGWCRRYYRGDEVETKSDEEEVENSEDPSYKRCGYYNHCYYSYGRKHCRSYYRCHYGR